MDAKTKMKKKKKAKHKCSIVPYDISFIRQK